MAIINEELARRSKENMSFSDYKPGSATAEYNASIQDAREKIEAAKARVSDEGKRRLDNLLERYAANLATWTNKYNANGANHVSVMICGPSNYNMRAHNKYLNREGKLWEEYNDLLNIDHKISAIVHGDKIIKSSDADAIEKLREKLAKAQEEHAEYKAYNAQARKEGKDSLPAYVLSNSNGRIKGIKDRIAHLERLAAQAEAVPVEERTTEVNGIEIIDNIELNRVQIIFPGKPDADIRTKLKSNGFKWAPSHGAWQNYRSERALRIAQEICKEG